MIKNEINIPLSCLVYSTFNNFIETYNYKQNYTIKIIVSRQYQLIKMNNRTTLIEKQVVNNITIIFASCKLYDQPYRKHSCYPEKKRRRGGLKTGYMIYIFSGNNSDTLSFGFRILTYRKAKKFYESCYSHVKNTKLKDGCILPLWIACTCNGAIYEKRKHIDIVKYFGNKDFFPTFYMLLMENNLINDNISF